MSAEVELKRNQIKHVTVDVGWHREDLVFHFYAADFIIKDLDKKLDKLFVEVFNLEIVNKDKLLQDLHDSVYNQFGGDVERPDIYEKTEFFRRLKDIEKLSGIHKAWTDIPVDSKHHKGMIAINCWSYVIKRVDRMFLDKKVELLFKKFETELP